MPPVLNQPEPLADLQARYPKALERIFVQEQVRVGGTRPGEVRACVFDFEDGLRFIVSREQTSDGHLWLHLSASFSDRCKIADEFRLLGITMPKSKIFAKWLRSIPERFRELSGDTRELKFIGVSEGKIPHWIIEENPSESDPIVEGLMVGAEELHGLMETAKQSVEAILPDDSLVPQLVVLTRDRPGAAPQIFAYALAVPFNEDEEKRTILAGIGRDLYEKKLFPVAVTLTAEAWGSKQEGEGPHPEPRNDPNREECITIFGTTLGGKHSAMTAARVRRDDQNRMHLAEPFELISDSCSVPILNYLFHGFFAKTAARTYGINLEERT